MLDYQVNILSCDTGDFYSNKESRLHKLNHKARSERKKLLVALKTVINRLNDSGFDDETFRLLEKQELDLSDYEESIRNLCYRYIELKRCIGYKEKAAKKYKDMLLKLLSNKVEANIATNGKHHTRQLNSDNLSEKNIISVFNSSFIRMMGISRDEFTDNFMVIQVYYFDIIRDLILHGFEYNGERYIFYTASAGQIRTKKTVFIKESVWNKYEKTIMCGLTLESINAKGGNNPNKHLSYMALSNSATDLWEGFDIDKTIVIDDFETKVSGTYDLIDDSDYSIKRITDYVPITHTDGAGMILPHAFGAPQKNVMVRLPWVKGLLGCFDFVRFINDYDCPTVIKDIYGDEHDIIAEDIQVIFTKSQFKMH